MPNKQRKRLNCTLYVHVTNYRILKEDKQKMIRFFAIHVGINAYCYRKSEGAHGFTSLKVPWSCFAVHTF